MHIKTHVSALALLAALALPAGAQDHAAAPDAPPSTGQASGEAQAAATDAALLTVAQLEDLLAPVALFPDTLLMQLLVAATYPLQVVKADQTVAGVAGLPEDERKAAIEAEGYDPSVEVLAVAFPDVLQRMADNIDWTETVGDAMLAQSDDVMDAIQVLRQQAIETGALIDSEQQDVSVEETVSSSGAPEETVIIQPTNPEVVYVPQYDPAVVYDTNRYSVGDALLTGAIVWGTFALIDKIFDDDDHWYGYWGCRNCGGWHGRPIIRNPDIDLDIDGNIDFDRTININPNIKRDGDRLVGWQPDQARRDQARDKLSERRDSGTARINFATDTRGDQLRQQLSERSGARDISRQGSGGQLRDGAIAAGAAGGAVAGHNALKRSSERTNAAINRPSTQQAPLKRPNVNKPAAAGAGASRPAGTMGGAQKIPKKQAASRPASGAARPALKKNASGAKARAASNRGSTSRAKLRR